MWVVRAKKRQMELQRQQYAVLKTQRRRDKVSRAIHAAHCIGRIDVLSIKS